MMMKIYIYIYIYIYLFLYIYTKDTYLQPLVSCCLYTAIIRLRKKDSGEIEKIEKIVKRMFTLELSITLCACVCVCVCV